ncbi:MAG: autotransporter domain-containing protein [Alphaproteobacteria bacterium]|nr:autotransporter domain-containing protein [Alphaproteobacteria bacterium]
MTKLVRPPIQMRCSRATPGGRALVPIVLVLAWLSAAASAQAACVPNGPAVPSGATVTCTGADTTGVGNGTQNNVTVTVQPGATITLGNNSRPINLNDNSNVTNNGSVTVGSQATAITAGNNGTLTNAGVLSGSVNAKGFEVQNGNTVTNAAGGAINLGVGIGISAQDGNTVVNNGAITTGANSLGIIAANANTVTNNGTIKLGPADATPGGSDAQGVTVTGSGNTVVNNGAITVGDAVTHRVAGIIDTGGANTITNNGTITVGAAIINVAAAATGVELAGGTTFINNGTITVGAGAIGIYIGPNPGTTVVNNGSVVAGANGTALFSFGSTINNSGKVDGIVFVAGPLNNSGLITITNPGTPLAVSNFDIFGPFTQTASGILALRVNNAGAADTLTAKKVNGTANLDGTLRAVLQPGLYAAVTQYSGVVTATNPITTRFAQAQAFAPGGAAPLVFFTLTPTYNSKSVDLTLNRIGFGAVAGETLNQQRVGAALDSAYSTSLSGNAATFYANLLQSTSAGVLDQLSGEGTSATQNAAFFANDLFNTAMSTHALGWRMGDRAGFVPATPLGYAAAPTNAASAALVTKAPPAYWPAWRAWGAGFGGGQSIGGDAAIGSANVTNRSAGGAVGLDRQINGDLLMGLAVGGGRTSFAVADRATSGSADAVEAGAYVLRQWGAFYAMGLASYAHFDNRTTRTIAGIGPSETAIGAFGSDLIGGKLEIGNTFSTWWNVNVTPFAAVQASSLHQAGYTEASTVFGGAPGLMGLTYQPVTVNSLPTFLGLQFDTRTAWANGMVWSPYLRAAWVHEFSPNRTITASLATLGIPAFTVDGARAVSDAARIDLGSQLAITRNISLSASFNGEFSGREQIYAGTGALRVTW